MAEHSPQFENTLSRVREQLRSEGIKLWLPPFTNSDGGPGGYPEDMMARFSASLSLPPEHVTEALEHLRTHAVAKLQTVERFSNSGIATVKVHLTGNIPVGLKNRIQIQTGLHVSGAEFRKSLSTEAGLDPGKLKLICKGHVIEDDKSLESQQVKNNGQIMVLVLSESSAEAQVKHSKEEEAMASVLRTRKAAEALSRRTDDYNDDHVFLEIRDQEGKTLNLPENERKALALAMTFHEKGRSALKQRKYAEALLLLLEADKEFGHCRAQILKAVDNYGILCLDIVWSYFWLKSIIDLPNAEEKLQKCKECFERSYGQNLERLTSVRGGSGGELVLFVRLHVLEAVCAYHRGDLRSTAALLDKAEDEKGKLDIDKNKLTQLLLMGFTEAEARLGLRACRGDATSAVDYITQKRQEKEERRKNEGKERKRKGLERKLGKTANGEWVNVDTYEALVTMGFSKHEAAAALRQANNDINNALQTLQDHPELLHIRDKSSRSEWNDIQISDEQVAQAVSLGFSVESSREALKRFHGDVQQAIDMLVSCEGVLPPSSSTAMECTCHVCGGLVGDAHSCIKCNRPIHVICGKPEGEEGYGQKVTCTTCQQNVTTETAVVIGVKRQWDWKNASLNQEKNPVPEKKQKLTMSKPEKRNEKYVCMECLESCLRDKKEEKFASLCRTDASTMKRHKKRWHATLATQACTVVPFASPEAKAVRERYAKMKAREDSSSTTSSKYSRTVHGLEKRSYSPPVVSDVETSAAVRSESSLDPKEASVSLGTIRSFLPTGAASSSSNDQKEAPLAQPTMLSFLPYNEPKGTYATSTKSQREVTLQNVVDAISSLSLKVDNFGKQHASLEQLVFEDDDVRTAILSMREATNIRQLADSSEFLEFFYDEKTETSILRCLPCFKVHLAARPTISSLSPFEAQRIINTTSNGTLGSGIIFKKDTTRLLIEGHNQVWYRQKKSSIDHLCLMGEGSTVHQKAVNAYQQEMKILEKRTAVTSNIFRAVITDLKLGAAARHFETLISFLACCSVDVGAIGHSRNNFNDILYCLEKTVNGRINVWLNQPLPSTQLPPHIWATVDKGTPSRTTNQAILVVARDETGVPCPIPVASPGVYSEFEQASYDVLAELLTKSIENHFSKEVLSRLCGVAADGPYQASGFRRKLLEALNIVETREDHLALPVTWDAAHILNLGVSDVKDSKSPSGTFFQMFLKRCNVFNTILAHGKGFAFLQLVDETARRPVAYAGQRFASSSYEQWRKIEQSYGSFWKAFEALYPNRDEEEELQYMIAGSDFVADLLACLDIMEPVVDLMLRVQSLDTPVWKLKIWWPKVKAKLLEVLFPRLQKAGDTLKPGGKYKGVELLEGWLVTKDEGKRATGGRFTWKLREESDIKEDHKRLASDLMNALDQRVQTAVSDHSLTVLQVFDAASLVGLQCGALLADGVVKLEVEEGEYDNYGVRACEAILTVASNMEHIQKSGMDLDPRLAFRYMGRIKEAVKAGIWKSLCPSWFMVQGTDEPLKPQDATLVLFEPAPSDTLDAFFKMKFASGKEYNVRLHEQNVFSSFYSQEDIYSIAQPPSCAILDIVLAKGGPEAIAESYYSCMRAQQQSGGQSNETLSRRTKLNWCLPSLKKCDDIIHESVSLYLRGDDVIHSHRRNAFFSGYEKHYSVSKVVDRIDAYSGRCPFLANK